MRPGSSSGEWLSSLWVAQTVPSEARPLHNPGPFPQLLSQASLLSLVPQGLSTPHPWVLRHQGMGIPGQCEAEGVRLPLGLPRTQLLLLLL